MKRTRTRRALRLAALAATLVAAAVLPFGATGASNGAPTIEAVSTLPQYVSGGDVLVRITLHDDRASAKHLRVERNGEDVTGSFRTMPDGSLLGLVDGLDLGENSIVARANGRGQGTPPGRSATLQVVDHPLSGPLFSGPQQQPFFCETVANGLGPALDDDCSAPTQVSYRYRTTAGAFATLADPTQRPADLAQTTTLDGRTVDYVVRVEKGVIDRAVYELAALYDPAAEPSPYTPEPGWNGRLVYTFGGGCNVGYHQGVGNGGVVNDLFLSRGYAVASSSLNVYDNNCSEVISAEVALMVKEHFIETYGVPRYTIGWGGSGGAIQQHLIGNNYPGILDGIVPGVSFQDSITLGTVPDCRLLAVYFGSPAGLAAGWTNAQRAAASGYGTWNSCLFWHLAFASRTNALEACPGAVPAPARYHPVTNPGGIKCTSFEQIATQLGRNPANGFAWRPLDNVGIQYGLGALQTGAITPEQFVSLNENVGGFDVIGNVVPGRVAADPIGIVRAYETGRVNTGGLGLASTPIIDVRTYTDLPTGDIHTRVHSFVMRERLQEANGTAANHVMLVANAAGTPAMTVEALTQMDAWLAGIHADEAPGTAAERTIRNRPGSLTDACWAGATKIVEAFSYGLPGQCEALYPTFAETRTVAGAGLASDVFKCQLKPLSFADYAATFTPAQQARLQASFPTGVCDWSKPGVDERAPLGTWLDYGS
ncbi:MAG TPA: DUF6351 family protein [Gaiellaceae bacterium]|nr:DUF6351 family protein [Gaiellaceae bacterium]